MSIVVVEVDGRDVRLDDRWLSGFCRAQGGLPAKTREEAARWWAANRATKETEASE